MDFLFGAVTTVINAMAAVLRSWSFTRNIGDDISKVTPYLQKANMLIPVDTALSILGLYISVQLALMAYYWITRTINLIRGAG